MDDMEIYRSAKLYINQFGAEASIQAALRIDALAEAGDVQGVAAWKRIMRAIQKLETTDGTRH